MRKRLILAATVLLALLGLGAVPAIAAATAAHHTITSAAAPASSRNCPKGDVCIFSKANFAGSEKDIAVSMPGCFDTFPFAVVSAINNSAFDITFFTSTNCTGTPILTLEEYTAAGSISPAANSFLATVS